MKFFLFFKICAILSKFSFCIGVILDSLVSNFIVVISFSSKFRAFARKLKGAVTLFDSKFVKAFQTIELIENSGLSTFPDTGISIFITPF